MNLREQQDRDYEKALQQDLWKAQEQQMEQWLEWSYTEYIDSLRLPEPEASVSHTCLLRIFLPNSVKIQRRFLWTNTIRDIANFLVVYYYDQYKIKSPNLEIRKYNQTKFENTTASLLELKITNREMLYVLDLDKTHE